MTKRRLEDSAFANVLRQKPKEDGSIKQLAGMLKSASFYISLSNLLLIIAKKTFELLMNAQKRSREMHIQEDEEMLYLKSKTSHCFRCSWIRVCEKCNFCEQFFCQDCTQQCMACRLYHCTTCSIIE